MVENDVEVAAPHRRRHGLGQLFDPAPHRQQLQQPGVREPGFHERSGKKGLDVRAVVTVLGQRGEHLCPKQRRRSAAWQPPIWPAAPPKRAPVQRAALIGAPPTTYTHSHTHSLTHSLTYSLTHTHTHTHTHTVARWCGVSVGGSEREKLSKLMSQSLYRHRDRDRALARHRLLRWTTRRCCRPAAPCSPAGRGCRCRSARPTPGPQVHLKAHFGHNTAISAPLSTNYRAAQRRPHGTGAVMVVLAGASEGKRVKMMSKSLYMR